MKEILAILRKDVRHLWPGILLAAGFTALRGWMDSRLLLGVFAKLNLVNVLWFFSCVYLGVSVIHQEPVPGDRQYWLTRPIAWPRLLAAKALFFGLFIHAPFVVTELLSLSANGISPGRYIPQILFNDAAWMGTFSLAVAGVALVTGTLMQFVWGLLAALAPPLVTFVLSDRVFHGGREWEWAGLEWIRSSAEGLLVLLFAGGILILQYSYRRTALSRVLLIAAVVLITAGPFLGGWRRAFALQQAISKSRIDAGGIRISVVPPGVRLAPRGRNIDAAIPVVIMGLPSGAMLLCERIELRVDGPGGKSWDSGWNSRSGIPSLSEAGGPAEMPADGVYEEHAGIDKDFYDALQNAAVDLRARFAFTLLMNTAKTPVRTNGRSILPRDGLCHAMQDDLLNLVSCAWPGGAPARAYVRVRSTRTGFSTEHLLLAGSYGPFPAEGSIWTRGATGFQTITGPVELSVETWQPAAHFERELDVRGVRPAGNEARP